MENARFDVLLFLEKRKNPPLLRQIGVEILLGRTVAFRAIQNRSQHLQLDFQMSMRYNEYGRSSRLK